MPIPIRPTHPTDRDDLTVQVTDDGSRTLVCSGTSDAYHSGCGAKSETRHVYLENTGLAERLRSGQASSALEVGLGTSMAMLMTMDLAIRHATPLQYDTLESDWISAQTLSFLQPSGWVDQSWIVESYLAFRQSIPRSAPDGQYVWHLDQDRTATIHVGDALTWSPATTNEYDAIFFDPFCPENAPSFWTVRYLAQMRQHISEQGRIATYSCSRAVREAFEQAGWKVQRIAGPKGGKREVLVAMPD
ncbi:MAG: tRNA (5-methylaminomethyl-2-thiouridine)(34)-methyltransferase MnmD [Planctomycetota bacterium]